VLKLIGNCVGYWFEIGVRNCWKLLLKIVLKIVLKIIGKYWKLLEIVVGNCIENC
jgi:hypothetical protein